MFSERGVQLAASSGPQVPNLGPASRITVPDGAALRTSEVRWPQIAVLQIGLPSGDYVGPEDH